MGDETQGGAGSRAPPGKVEKVRWIIWLGQVGKGQQDLRSNCIGNAFIVGAAGPLGEVTDF